MSDQVARYAFLPWLRRGVVGQITRRDGVMTGAPRATVPITLSLNAAGDPRDVTAPIELFGPGEVKALDPRVLIRTVPRPSESDAEPSYFPAAEFNAADFPWRFTPARADATRTRLRPWIVLVVIAEDEIEEETPALGDGTLATVTVTDGAALPLLSQTWAWAHVQVDGFDPAAESLADVVRTEQRRVRSRLLAPRHLANRTRYRALLVPAWERGRLAGLKEPLDETVDALVPAWQPSDTHVRLPVYHGWSFQTGDVGDFETLVRRLEARAVEGSVGLQDMDVSAPDLALPPAAPGSLAMEGALMSPAAQATAWDPAARSAFTAALATVLNRPTQALGQAGVQRTVAPPLWVRWQAARDSLDAAAGGQPRWFNDLNADPRLRAAAGLGAEVVRANDQQLMSEAWSQVEGILEANAELRRSQVSREASSQILTRHLAPLRSDVLLAVAAPMHAHVTASPVTVHETLRRSPVPDAALGGGLRRTLRPAGPIGRRLNLLRDPGIARPLLERLNLGEVRARPPEPTPAGMLTPERVLTAPGVLRAPGPNLLLLAIVALVLALVGIVLLLVAWPLAIAVLLVAAAVGYAAWRAWLAASRRARVIAVLDGTATPEEVRDTSPASVYVPGASPPGAAPSQGPAPPGDLTGADPGARAAARAATQRFKDALGDLIGEIDAPPRPGDRLVVADLPALAGGLVAQVDPATTIHAAIGSRLAIADWVTWGYRAQDPIEPIMAAPKIDTPMYEPLRDLSQDWLMPGLGTIPPDTATLLVTNQRFIEAYMSGLSHEMSRELLYHEYPTDQRGTYFQHFWDWRGLIRPDRSAPDPATMRDIEEIQTWSPPSDLGDHTGRRPPPPEDHLVLLVKGEVLRRYPETLVYAVRTVIGDDGRRTLGDEESFPIFEGRLDPDIAFYGFDLLPSDVRGDPEPQQDQGWYFVLQEQSTEPVFGLDPDDGNYAAKPASWNDLNWAQLASDGDTLAALRYIDLDGSLPDTTAVVQGAGEPQVAWHAESGPGPAGANGSDLAYATLQHPFRVAIHGSDMLPPEEGGP